MELPDKFSEFNIPKTAPEHLSTIPQVTKHEFYHEIHTHNDIDAEFRYKNEPSNHDYTSNQHQNDIIIRSSDGRKRDFHNSESAEIHNMSSNSTVLYRIDTKRARMKNMGPKPVDILKTEQVPEESVKLENQQNIECARGFERAEADQVPGSSHNYRLQNLDTNPGESYIQPGTTQIQQPVGSNHEICDENTEKKSSNYSCEAQKHASQSIKSDTLTDNDPYLFTETSNSPDLPGEQTHRSDDESFIKEINDELETIIRLSTETEVKRKFFQRNLHSLSIGFNFFRFWLCTEKYNPDDYVFEGYFHWIHPDLFKTKADKKKLDLLFDYIHKKFANSTKGCKIPYHWTKSEYYYEHKDQLSRLVAVETHGESDEILMGVVRDGLSLTVKNNCMLMLHNNRCVSSKTHYVVVPFFFPKNSLTKPCCDDSLHKNIIITEPCGTLYVMEDLPNQKKSHYIQISNGPFMPEKDLCKTFINKILRQDFVIYKPKGIGGYKYSMNDSFVMPYIKIKEWENKKISLLAMKNKLSKYSLNFWDGMSREFRFSILNSGIVLKQTNFAACRKHAAREIVYSIVYYITERLIELEAHISTEKKK